MAEEGRSNADLYVSVWWAYALFCCNSWVWSAVFHARDTRATEALDYLAADSVVAAMLFASLVRTAALTGCDSPCAYACSNEVIMLAHYQHWRWTSCHLLSLSLVCVPRY